MNNSHEQLIMGDCLEKMKDIPDKSIDLIISDPPYNIGKDSWDKIDDYQNWCTSWILECQRVLKDNGSFYIFHDQIEVMLELMSNIKKKTKLIFKQMIVWNKIDVDFKNYGFVQQRLSNGGMRNYYDGFTEYILYYTFQDETGLTTVMLDTNNFSSLRKYFKDLQEFIGLGLKQINIRLGHRKSEHAFYWKTTQWDLPTKETYQELIDKFQIDKWDLFREYESLRLEYESLRYTFNMTRTTDNVRGNSNVWLYPPAKQIGHVTPKPVELVENIIKHSSNENDIILDPFAGSGTTAVAYLNTKRNYICIEKDENYFNIMENRIKQHQPKLEVFTHG